MEIMQGAEPFYFEGTNGKAIILVHGYTGTPSQLLLLGELLHGAGYTVAAPLLSGHGTNVKDLAKTTAQDWYSDVLRVYNGLRETYFDVGIVGISMGGLLALRLAAENPIWKLVSIATPVFLTDRRLKWLWFLKYFMTYVDKGEHVYPIDPVYNVAYKDQIPVRPLSSMLNLINECKRRYLRRVHCPVFILQGGLDGTVKPESAEFILHKIFSRDKQILILEDSGHMVILDKQREFAMRQIWEFLGRDYY